MICGQWKKGDIEENEFGRDTLPDKRNIRTSLNLLEAQSLSLVVVRFKGEKDKGRMLTHAI